MSFTTLSFLLFLLVVWAAYWSIPGRRAQNALLVVASYVFYGWWDWRFCFLMLATSLVDYVVALALDRSTSQRLRRWLMTLSVVCNLGMLGFFKYYGFFVDSLQQAALGIGVHLDPPLLNVVLPVGISFYTFQTLSYTIDVYRRDMPATRSAIDFLAYVAFFPQLVAGPIERGTRLIPQFLRPRFFDPVQARDGLRQILWGVFKKLVFADNLAIVVNRAYSHPEDTPGVVLAYATVCFAFQIYADFSAYSDIAIGTARMFGIELSRNFALPYFSVSLDEFWRRWHISLSTWFRDYLYVPLGGNRGSRARQAVNLLVTFVVSGLWHGASWNFVLWGVIHGLAMVPFLWIRGRRRGPNDLPADGADLPRGRALLGMVSTFTVVCVAWVFFRATSLGDALVVLHAVATEMFDPHGWQSLAAEVGRSIGSGITLPAIPLFLAVEWATRASPHPLHVLPASRPVRWGLYTVLFWTAMLLQGPTTEFIYFQF